jgi:metal-sulfur cluster biosynthetic enzyme
MQEQRQKKLQSLVRGQLQKVLDPELGISIVDLGLVYGIAISEKGICTITMTLTTIGCPLFGVIQKEIEDKTMEIDGIEDVKIDLTFDPPWTPDKMSEESRIRLGLD